MDDFGFHFRYVLPQYPNFWYISHHICYHKQTLTIVSQLSLIILHKNQTSLQDIFVCLGMFHQIDFTILWAMRIFRAHPAASAQHSHHFLPPIFPHLSLSTSLHLVVFWLVQELLFPVFFTISTTNRKNTFVHDIFNRAIYRITRCTCLLQPLAFWNRANNLLS